MTSPPLAKPGAGEDDETSNRVMVSGMSYGSIGTPTPSCTCVRKNVASAKSPFSSSVLSPTSPTRPLAASGMLRLSASEFAESAVSTALPIKCTASYAAYVYMPNSSWPSERSADMLRVTRS